MVHRATDLGSACPRAKSPDFSSFFFDFPTSQNGAFYQINKKYRNKIAKKKVPKSTEKMTEKRTGKKSNDEGAAAKRVLSSRS
jgi:hypothetical protein